MGKMITLIITLVLLTAMLPLSARADTPTIPALNKSAVFTIGSKTVTVDGTPYTMDVAPYIDSASRTQVPVRYLGDVLGMTATWNAQKQQVTLDEQKFSAQENLVIGKDQLGWADGVKDGMTTMDTVPVIVPPGRTMLPARYVAEAVGYNVTWDGTNRTVTVTPPGQGGGIANDPPVVGPAGVGTGISSGTNPAPDAQGPPVNPPH